MCDYSALFCAGVLFEQKFQLILTNNNYVKVVKNEWPINGRRSSFVARPIKKVKAHLSKMSFWNMKQVTRQTRSVVRVSKSEHRAEEGICHTA